jgi:NADH:ubiquinone oxidoreductase subunit 3 (subunit A)
MIGAAVVGTRLTLRLMGSNRPALAPSQRRTVLVFLTFSLAYALFVAWAFLSGHDSLGIKTLVAFIVLDPILIMSFSIRSARKRQ